MSLERPVRLNIGQWNDLLKAGRIEDISSELSDSFLVYGQTMRAKIVLEGTKYYVSGWHYKSEQWVDLKPVSF